VIVWSGEDVRARQRGIDAWRSEQQQDRHNGASASATATPRAAQGKDLQCGELTVPGMPTPKVTGAGLDCAGLRAYVKAYASTGAVPAGWRHLETAASRADVCREHEGRQ
jgi:hypothetical protein